MTSSFQALNAVKARNWPTMEVTPLDAIEKEQIIRGYLEGIYGKTLDPEQKDLIVAAEQTNNPLYLRSLLDEVTSQLSSVQPRDCDVISGFIADAAVWKLPAADADDSRVPVSRDARHVVCENPGATGRRLRHGREVRCDVTVLPGCT